MTLKTWNTVKDVLLIVFAVLILFLIITAILSHTPKSSTPFHVTLNAVKITDPGEPVDTVPVTIEGSYKQYFFSEQSCHPDQIEVNISALDGFTDFVPVGTDNGLGEVFDVSPHGYQRTHYYAYKDGRPYSISICFSKDFNYWSISVSQWDAFYKESQMMAYYVGSTNENATLEDINNVFTPIDYKKAWSNDTETTD